MIYTVRIKKSYTKLEFQFNEGRRAIAFAETIGKHYIPEEGEKFDMFIEVTNNGDNESEEE